MAWNHQRWGTLADPIHKSDLQKITSSLFGCPRAFKHERDERESPSPVEPRTFVDGKSVLGIATHETINRALTNPGVVDRLLGGGKLPEARVAEVFASELERARGGRELVWYGKSDNPERLTRQKVVMVTALLNDLHRYVSEVVLVEPGFIAKLGDYWIAGQVDLIYRPRSNPQGLAFTDWKSGAQLPHPIDLEHGFESGFYAHALKAGVFLPREEIRATQADDGTWVARGPVIAPYAGSFAAEHSCTEASIIQLVHPNRIAAERACMEASLIQLIRQGEHRDPRIDLPGDGVACSFDVFPDELHYVHLLDYVPYDRAGTKKVDRREHLQWYGVSHLAQVRYQKGDLRGPGWYPMARRESDVARLESLLRDEVRAVRMGIFPRRVDGTKCTRCPHKQPCLTSGYDPTASDKEQLVALSKLDLGGAEDGLSAL